MRLLATLVLGSVSLSLAACADPGTDPASSSEDAYSVSAATPMGSIADGETRRFEPFGPRCNGYCMLTFEGTAGDYADVELSTATVAGTRLWLYGPDGKLVAENGRATITSYERSHVRALLTQGGTYSIVFVEPRSSEWGSIRYAKNAPPAQSIFEEASCVGEALDAETGRAILDSEGVDTKTIGSFRISVARECPNNNSLFPLACSLDADGFFFGPEPGRIVPRYYERRSLTVPPMGEIELRRAGEDIELVLIGAEGDGEFADRIDIHGNRIGTRHVTGRMSAKMKLPSIGDAEPRFPPTLHTSMGVDWSRTDANGSGREVLAMRDSEGSPGYEWTILRFMNGVATRSCLRLTESSKPAGVVLHGALDLPNVRQR